MEMSNTYIQRQYLMYLVIISIVQTGFLPVVSANTSLTNTTNITSAIETSYSSITTKTNFKTSNLKKTNQKKILLDKSRGLSAFFIFGIAINIIMAVAFGWWFSKEWRRSKK